MAAIAPVTQAASCNFTNRPPDSPIISGQDGIIESALYWDATRAYPHGVLGDRIEAGAIGLIVTGDDKGACVDIHAPKDTVFEDLAPRLFDVTGDGKAEVIAINSHSQFGARVVVYALEDNNTRAKLIAATPYIGTRFRWLAIAGIGDLDGDGAVEIAYIDRPHLAKTLRVWRYRTGGLVQIANQTGLTNHRIGENYITGGLRDCGVGAELILVDAQWQRIIATQFQDNKLISREIGPYQGRDGVDRALRC